MLVHGHQVDPPGVPDRLAARRDRGPVLAQHGHLEVGLDQYRREPVHGGRPADVGLEQCLPLRPALRLPLPDQGPVQFLPDQRKPDGAVPVPHAREVVDGQRVADGPVLTWRE